MTNYTDREILELAARAVGINGTYTESFFDPECPISHGILHNKYGTEWCWNPIEDDTDAFRLMIDLHLMPKIYDEIVIITIRHKDLTVMSKIDKKGVYAATRRAIVLAAAELGAIKQ